MATSTIDTEKLAWEHEELEDAWTGSRIHLAFFVIMNVAMAFYDLVMEPGDLWFFWPLAGWGMGVTAHDLGLRQHQRTLERRAERAGVTLSHLR